MKDKAGWVLDYLKRPFADEQVVLGLLAVVVGAIAAYGAIAFRLGADAIAYLGYGVVEEAIPAAVRDRPAWLVVLVPTLGGLLLGLLAKHVLPGPQPQGVADVIEASALRAGRMPFKLMWSGALFNAASIGVGGSVGREGPIVHMSASLAAFAARRLSLSVPLTRTLLGCGVAAGVAAAFNAPIAGVFFALEVVVGSYGLGAFSPVVIASVIGTIVTRVHIGDNPAFALSSEGVASFWELPAFLILGVVSAAAAIVLMRGIANTRRLHERLNVPSVLRPALAGLALGCLALAFPEVLGVGYEVTSRALAGGFGLQAFALLALAKLAATILCLGSGFGGGIFSPSLAVGALVGGAFGVVATGVFPDLGSAVSVYATVGMGAVAACTLGAPISTIIMIFELTSNYAVTFALMAAVAVASLVSRNLYAESYFAWQLRRRGVNLDGQRELSLLRQRRVADVMLDAPATVREGAGLSAMKAHFRAHPADPIFVVDGDGGLIGVIDVEALAEAVLADAPAEVDAGGLARKPPVVLVPSDDLAVAFTRCQTLQEEHIPVVRDKDGSRLVGEVRFSALVLAYNKALLQARAIEQGRRWRERSS